MFSISVLSMKFGVVILDHRMVPFGEGNVTLMYTVINIRNGQLGGHLCIHTYTCIHIYIYIDRNHAPYLMKCIVHNL